VILGTKRTATARAAAQLNRESNRIAVSVNQGIHQIGDGNQQNKEIANAFAAAADANSIYGGTVTGITFTNEYVTDPGKGATVLNMIRNNKNRGFRVGTRIHTCGEIHNPNSALKNVISDIVRDSHFIYCNLYPSADVVNGGIPRAVEAVGNAFFGIRAAFKKINPNIEVAIGETGWPSQGKSFNNSPNSVSNLVSFWTQMGQWAAANQVKVQIFEAFDEPWKSDVNNGDPNASNGK
jgi:exo-beta-1,3-glucanase (GH17 family)